MGVAGHGVVAVQVPVGSAVAHLGGRGALVAEGGEVDGRAVRGGALVEVEAQVLVARVAGGCRHRGARASYETS